MLIGSGVSQVAIEVNVNVMLFCYFIAFFFAESLRVLAVVVHLLSVSNYFLFLGCHRSFIAPRTPTASKVIGVARLGAAETIHNLA